MEFPEIVVSQNYKRELPKYVLPLVLAYAKPHMKYYREYKEGMRDLGVKDWPAVRKKLCSPDGEEVLEAFQTYVKAYVKTNQMNAEFMEKGRPSGLIHNLSKQMRLRDLLDRAFRILLMGEAAVLQEESKDMYA
jgi:hypothetical protein